MFTLAMSGSNGNNLLDFHALSAYRSGVRGSINQNAFVIIQTKVCYVSGVNVKVSTCKTIEKVVALIGS